MKRNLIGGLAVAGALTLWSGVSSFAADTPQQIADKAIAKVTGTEGCATKAQARLTELGSSPATASLKGDAAADLKELLSDASDDVAEIALDAVADINDTLADFNEELTEEPLTGNALTAATTEFTAEVDGIQKKACAKISKLMLDVEKEFTALTTVKVENEDENDNDQGENERVGAQGHGGEHGR